MAEILLLRHGQTRGNRERRYIGRTDEPLLAQEADHLREMAKNPIFEPEIVFCSPMQRCAQTAQVLFKKTPMAFAEGLKERDFGLFEGHTYEELKDDPAYAEWIASAGKTAPPQGECWEDWHHRTIRAFRECVEGREKSRIAIVAHGGTIMAVLSHFTEEKDLYAWQVKNVQGYIFEYKEEKIRHPRFVEWSD